MESFFNRLAARPMRVVVALSLLLLLSGNWILPLIDRDEPRFAEASREMLQGGDYVSPHLNGAYRFDKPPLIYWCQTVSYRALGITPFAARLPSVLFATATAALLALWGRRMGHPKAGFYAGLIFITCLQIQVHGRLSVADIPMIFFVSASAWAGWELTRPECGHRVALWWLFQICMALGFLAKGPPAWMPLAGMVVGAVLYPKAFRFPWWSGLAGFVVILALISLWGIPALYETKGEYFKVGIGHHVVERSLGTINGHGASGVIGWIALLPLYFLTFIPSFFPWALKVPAALQRWWGTRREDAFGWYLLMQAFLIFAVFSVVRTKLPHYTLPAFPMLALWLALQIEAHEKAAQTDIQFKPSRLNFIQKMDRWVSMPKGVFGMTALSLGLTWIGFSLAAPHFMTTNLWREVRPYAKPETRVAVVGFGEDSLEWEFRQTVTNYVERIALTNSQAFLKQGPPCVLIVPTKHFTGDLSNAANHAIIKRATGIDTTYLKKWDMTAVILQ
jgi:4-amino-4-deoxy-L-arabinose transferase-like glycosyltransferase